MADIAEPIEAHASAEAPEAVAVSDEAPAAPKARRKRSSTAPDDEARRPGRRPGSPKVPGSGRKKGTPNAVTRDLRELIARRGRPLELLADVCRGVKIRVGPQAGPGDATYEYPCLQMRVEAAKILAKKLLPDLSAQELGGIPDGEPIAIATTTEVSDLELSRHVAHLLRRGDPEAVSDEVQRRPIPEGLSPPVSAETPAAPVSTANRTDAAQQSAEAADESPQPPAEPEAPAEGESVVFTPSSQQQLLGTGIVKIVGCAPVRPGLPVIFELHSGRRGIHQRGSWQLLLPHLRRVLGLEDGDAWPAWKVEREAKPAEPARHDQMPLPPPKPEVHRRRPR